MTVFSSLRHFMTGGGLGARSLALKLRRATVRLGVRHGSGSAAHRHMVIRGSEFDKRRLFDEIHYQVCLVGIPFVLFIAAVDIFIGPATLTEIPDCYEPEHWEYYKHPIERWYAKYILHPEPVAYEIEMSSLYEDVVSRDLSDWEKKVRQLMRERQDYKGYYFMSNDMLEDEMCLATALDFERQIGRHLISDP